MKIKIFKFQESSNFYDRVSKECFNNIAQEVFDIYGNVVNDFIKDKDVIDIKVNTTQTKYHNNCGYHENDIVFTILYK